MNWNKKRWIMKNRNVHTKFIYMLFINTFNMTSNMLNFSYLYCKKKKNWWNKVHFLMNFYAKIFSNIITTYKNCFLNYIISMKIFQKYFIIFSNHNCNFRFLFATSITLLKITKTAIILKVYRRNETLVEGS